MRVEHLSPITRQRLVSAVAGKGDCNGLLCQLAHAPRWQGGGVGEGFIEHAGNAIDGVELVGADRARFVIRGEEASHFLGMACFVRTGDIEADRAGLYRAAASLGHEGHYAGTIHSA